MKDRTKAPGEEEILARWLEEQAGDCPRLAGLGELQREQLAPGPGWCLELTGFRIAAQWQDVTGCSHQVQENDYTLRLRLGLPEGLAGQVPAELSGFLEQVNRKGQLTGPPPIGEKPWLLLGTKITKVPGDGELWEYRLGLAARHLTIIEL